MSTLRPAQHTDIPVLQDLIALSGRALSVGYYSPVQADAITRYVFGVDTQLIDDQTYFVIESGDRIVACGGWSKRRTLFGGDQTKSGPDPLARPGHGTSSHPCILCSPVRGSQGLGRQLMGACVTAAKQAGFNALELASTMPGEPLYLASGFVVLERFELDLPGGIRVPLSRMRREI